jgi:hypothetical protein
VVRINISIKKENKKELILLYFFIHIYIYRFKFFISTSLNKTNRANDIYLFGYVQIAEIFYVLNYSINFFIYCISGTLFRNQLSTALPKSRNSMR